jgi:hypothetical protein
MLFIVSNMPTTTAATPQATSLITGAGAAHSSKVGVFLTSRSVVVMANLVLSVRAMRMVFRVEIDSGALSGVVSVPGVIEWSC